MHSCVALGFFFCLLSVVFCLYLQNLQVCFQHQQLHEYLLDSITKVENQGDWLVNPDGGAAQRSDIATELRANNIGQCAKRTMETEKESSFIPPQRPKPKKGYHNNKRRKHK